MNDHDLITRRTTVQVSKVEIGCVNQSISEAQVLLNVASRQQKSRNERSTTRD
jgi:hypothetical protein